MIANATLVWINNLKINIDVPTIDKVIDRCYLAVGFDHNSC